MKRWDGGRGWRHDHYELLALEQHREPGQCFRPIAGHRRGARHDRCRLLNSEQQFKANNAGDDAPTSQPHHKRPRDPSLPDPLPLNRPA